MARGHLAEGKVLCAAIPGGFAEPRRLMGDEAVCIKFEIDGRARPADVERLAIEQSIRISRWIGDLYRVAALKLEVNRHVPVAN